MDSALPRDKSLEPLAILVFPLDLIFTGDFTLIQRFSTSPLEEQLSLNQLTDLKTLFAAHDMCPRTMDSLHLLLHHHHHQVVEIFIRLALLFVNEHVLVLPARSLPQFQQVYKLLPQMLEHRLHLVSPGER
jgi:hypothetical protein